MVYGQAVDPDIIPASKTNNMGVQRAWFVGDSVDIRGGWFAEDTLTSGDFNVLGVVKNNYNGRSRGAFMGIGASDSVVVGVLYLEGATQPQAGMSVSSNGSGSVVLGSLPPTILGQSDARFNYGHSVIIQDTGQTIGQQISNLGNHIYDYMLDTLGIGWYNQRTTDGDQMQLFHDAIFSPAMVSRVMTPNGWQLIVRDTVTVAGVGQVLKQTFVWFMAREGSDNGVFINVGDFVNGVSMYDNGGHNAMRLSIKGESAGDTTLNQSRLTGLFLDVEYDDNDSLLLSNHSGISGNVINNGGGFNRDVWWDDGMIVNEDGVIGNAVHTENHILNYDTIIEAFGNRVVIQHASNVSSFRRVWGTQYQLRDGFDHTSGGNIDNFIAIELLNSFDNSPIPDTTYFINNGGFENGGFVNADSNSQYYSFRWLDPNWHFHSEGHGQFGAPISSGTMEYRLEVNESSNGTQYGIFKTDKALQAKGYSYMHDAGESLQFQLGVGDTVIKFRVNGSDGADYRQIIFESDSATGGNHVLLENVGFGFSNVTTTERDNMQRLRPGIVVFNTTTTELNLWTGVAWVSL